MFRQDKERKAHFFQFETWRASLDSMYIIDGISIIVIAIVLQSLVFELLSIKIEESLNDLTVVSDKLSNQNLSQSERDDLNAELQTTTNEITDVTNHSYNVYSSLMNLVCILLLYFLKSVFEIVFTKLRGKVAEIFTVERLLNFFSSAVILYLVLKWYCVHDKVESDSPLFEKLLKMQSAMNDPIIKAVVGLGIVVGAQWCRVFFILRLNRTFGPLLEILITMLKKLIIFAVIFCLILIIFLFIGTITFFETQEFSAYDSAAIYLFSASLGGFDYSIFDSENVAVEKYYGYVFLTLYLVFTNVVLLNFLIAILTDIYAVLQQNRSSLYARQIIRVKQYLDDDEYYSCLVAAIVPFNILILPFAPFVISCKSR